MNSLLLTPEQAQALALHNANSTRALVPRQLNDGRLILNADVLSDPYFTDPTHPWLQILQSAQPITLTDSDLI